MSRKSKKENNPFAGTQLELPNLFGVPEEQSGLPTRFSIQKTDVFASDSDIPHGKEEITYEFSGKCGGMQFYLTLDNPDSYMSELTGYVDGKPLQIQKVSDNRFRIILPDGQVFTSTFGLLQDMIALQREDELAALQRAEPVEA